MRVDPITGMYPQDVQDAAPDLDNLTIEGVKALDAAYRDMVPRVTLRDKQDAMDIWIALQRTISHVGKQEGIGHEYVSQLYDLASSVYDEYDRLRTEQGDKREEF